VTIDLFSSGAAAASHMNDGVALKPMLGPNQVGKPELTCRVLGFGVQGLRFKQIGHNRILPASNRKVLILARVHKTTPITPKAIEITREICLGVFDRDYPRVGISGCYVPSALTGPRSQLSLGRQSKSIACSPPVSSSREMKYLLPLSFALEDSSRLTRDPRILESSLSLRPTVLDENFCIKGRKYSF